MNSAVMVAHLPIPIKNCNIPLKRLDELRKTHREVLKEVLRWVLQPLTYKQKPSTKSRYYHVLCGDGDFRRYKPVLAAWLADCTEYSNQHHHERHFCFWCECPKNKLGDFVPPDKQHLRRYHKLSGRLSDVNHIAADAELSSRHVHQGFNVFQHIPCIVSALPKPEPFHPMQIGMLDRLQKRIFHFMKKYERLDKKNVVWLSVPTYHDITPKNKSYEEISQSNGKQMKEMSRYLLGDVT
jgi:hypothetical protein